MQQFFLFALQHLGHGNTRPARHDFGDIVTVDLLLDEGFVALHLAQAVLYLGVLVLLLLDERVADFGHAAVVAVAFGTLSLKVELLDVDFVLLDLVDEFFLALPLGVVVALAVFEFGNLPVQVSDALLVAITLDGGTLNLQLRNLTRNLIQALRHAVHLDAQFGGGLIN